MANREAFLIAAAPIPGADMRVLNTAKTITTITTTTTGPPGASG